MARRATVTAATALGVRGMTVPVQVAWDRGSGWYSDNDELRRSRHRVLPALAACGVGPLDGRVTVAAPGLAGQPEALDLAIAVGLLACVGYVRPRRQQVFVGQLGLDGTLTCPVPPLALADCLPDRCELIVPADGLQQAGLVRFGHAERRVRGAKELLAVTAYLRHRIACPLARPDYSAGYRPAAVAGPAVDMADLHGQPALRRALEVAAAGAHPILVLGPVGEGKSLGMRCLPGILPPLTGQEKLELTAIYQRAGLIGPAEFIASRPYREVSRATSREGLLGGGSKGQIMPGAVTLAHHGVLALDELPEFSPRTIDLLRGPLQDGQVVISRVGSVRCVLPCRFLLAATGNLCPCGRFPHCACTPSQVRRYRARVSGAVMDRIDLKVVVQPLRPTEQLGGQREEGSDAVRARVRDARQRAYRRCQAMGLAPTANALLPASALPRIELAAGARKLLADAARDRPAPSTRSVHKVVRVARTLADLDGCAATGAGHVAAALALVAGPAELAPAAAAGTGPPAPALPADPPDIWPTG